MKIAVIIPAYNEELTIGNVVREYQAALPEAEVDGAMHQEERIIERQ